MIQDLRFKNKYKAGQAPRLDSGQAMMVATMFFLIISITIIFGLVGPIVRQQQLSSQLLTSRQSYFLAESGVEDVVFRLQTGETVGTTEVLNLNGSSATTITTNTSAGKDVAATGTVRTLMRKVKVELLLGEGVAFHYGIQVGAGGFSLSNNAGVNGNVYSNGNISGSNGSFITGDASAVGSITGVSVSGESQTGVSSQALPITDTQITDWKNEAAAGGTVGNQTLSGDDNILGPKKINGNLTLGNGDTLTVTGTLWITGNLVLSNSSIIKLSSGYASGDGVIIVDGVSTLSNGSTFQGSGSANSYIMLLSTNNSGSAISLDNNAGAVILYAPNGTVELSNGAAVKQISAKTISLSNNATITYEQGLVDAAFTNGPSGGYTVSNWLEVE
ncbi:MAG: hypothetical protein Q7R67_00435 [bacterium]|nr:hypothetical protein [bacterium]